MIQNFSTKFCVVWFFGCLLLGCEEQIPHPPRHLSQRLIQRVLHEGKAPDNKATKYAVLINGSKELRFSADVALAYQVLLENGFLRQNIYILDWSNGGTYFHPVDGKAAILNMTLLFNHLKKTINNKDTLFVSDHGGRIRGGCDEEEKLCFGSISTLHLVDTDLNQREFAEYIRKIHPKNGILLFDECHSGGFAEELDGSDFTIIASTQAEKLSYSEINDSFSGYFMLAFRNVATSDTDHSGSVSIAEAFEYAVGRHSFSRQHDQEPFIRSKHEPHFVFLK